MWIFCLDIKVRFKGFYFFYFPIFYLKIGKAFPKNGKINWIYTRKKMNPKIHVYLIPNFFVENKIVAKQKTLVQLKALQLYSSTLVIWLHTNKCLFFG